MEVAQKLAVLLSRLYDCRHRRPCPRIRRPCSQVRPAPDGQPTSTKVRSGDTPILGPLCAGLKTSAAIFRIGIDPVARIPVQGRSLAAERRRPGLSQQWGTGLVQRGRHSERPRSSQPPHVQRASGPGDKNALCGQRSRVDSTGKLGAEDPGTVQQTGVVCKKHLAKKQQDGGRTREAAYGC